MNAMIPWIRLKYPFLMKLDACGHDANMNYAYGDELVMVPYIKNEVVAIAPTHDSPIIFLNSPNYISEKFALIKDYIIGSRST